MRALGKCHNETVVISNLAPVKPFTVAIGRGVYPDIAQIQSLIEAKTKRLIAFDALDLAKTAGSTMALNMVLLGALMQTDLLPISTDQVKTTIESKTKAAFVEANLKAFDLGFKAVASS